MLFLIWTWKNALATLLQKDAKDGVMRYSLKIRFFPWTFKIKYLHHLAVRNSVAMIIESPSVSNVAFTVAWLHSFINWAFWFPWQPNCRHWLLRSSLGYTKQELSLLPGDFIPGSDRRWGSQYLFKWCLHLDFKPEGFWWIFLTCIILTVRLRYRRWWELTIV